MLRRGRSNDWRPNVIPSVNVSHLGLAMDRGKHNFGICLLSLAAQANSGGEDRGEGQIETAKLFFPRSYGSWAESRCIALARHGDVRSSSLSEPATPTIVSANCRRCKRPLQSEYRLLERTRTNLRHLTDCFALQSEIGGFLEDYLYTWRCHSIRSYGHRVGGWVKLVGLQASLAGPQSRVAVA